jgi:hypothetical protein
MEDDKVVRLKTHEIGHRMVCGQLFPPLYRVFESSTKFTPEAGITGPDMRYMSGPKYDFGPIADREGVFRRLDKITFLTPPSYGGPDAFWVYATACDSDDQVDGLMAGWDQATDWLALPEYRPCVYRSNLGTFVIQARPTPPGMPGGLLHYTTWVSHEVFGKIRETEIVDPLGRVLEEDDMPSHAPKPGDTATYEIEGQKKPQHFDEVMRREDRLLQDANDAMAFDGDSEETVEASDGPISGRERAAKIPRRGGAKVLAMIDPKQGEVASQPPLGGQGREGSEVLSRVDQDEG